MRPGFFKYVSIHLISPKRIHFKSWQIYSVIIHAPKQRIYLHDISMPFPEKESLLQGANKNNALWTGTMMQKPGFSMLML